MAIIPGRLPRSRTCGQDGEENGEKFCHLFRLSGECDFGIGTKRSARVYQAEADELLGRLMASVVIVGFGLIAPVGRHRLGTDVGRMVLTSMQRTHGSRKREGRFISRSEAIALHFRWQATGRQPCEHPVARLELTGGRLTGYLVCFACGAYFERVAAPISVSLTDADGGTGSEQQRLPFFTWRKNAS